MRIKFIDAQEMKKKHPKTFEAPTQKELEELKVDQFVKVSAEGERFWVELLQVKEQKMTGTVANDLVRSEHGLKFGDIVEIEKRHVYQIQ